MKYNPEIHHRRSIRLQGYDYSQAGLYYSTICTQNKACIFGKINNGKMVLNNCGRIVEKCLLAIPDHNPYTQLDQYVIMPNHIHCIIEITVGANDYSPLHSKTPLTQTCNESPQRPGTSKTIGSIIRGFKIGVTKWFRTHTDIHTVWQRNYYEHVIRNEKSYDQICEYIATNPLHWQDDEYHD